MAELAEGGGGPAVKKPDRHRGPRFHDCFPIGVNNQRKKVLSIAVRYKILY